MISEQNSISNLFLDLCDSAPSEFEEHLKVHNIDYKTLIPFASWSNEKYTRICLRKNDACELILLCWMPGQETAVHDHNNQYCQIYFLKGEFEERIFSKDNLEECEISKNVKAGDFTDMNHTHKMHKLKNVSHDVAMTLHYYTNPIENCNVYNESNNSIKKMSLSNQKDFSNDCSMSSELDRFVHITRGLLKDEIENPISNRIKVNDLYEVLNIGLNEEPIDDEEFYTLTQDIVNATPKTSSKLFFNQLFGGRQPKAVLGDLLAVMLNNSMYTYKVAGVQVGIEKEILQNVIHRIGYGESADGTFPTGGSMSNFKAILMARDKADAESRYIGMGKKLMAYTSSTSHYSLEKNAAFIGLGRENVRQIENDEFGQMKAYKLKEAIEQDIKAGFVPFFVNATAGTTVLDAYDPFLEIAKITKAHDIWLHIDGAYGGSVLFSKKYRYLLNGIEHSDSFCFNPHKMLGTPMTCSIIVVNDKKHLHDSFSQDANYLYQTDDDYNLGKTSFQCGRRNDAFKFWTLWKSKGTKGLEAIVDNQFYLADVARDYVKSNPDYQLYSFDNSISICFNYKDIPASVLCNDLYETNALLVGYGKFNGIEFVRLVTINSTNTKKDILNFFTLLEKSVETALSI